MDISVDSLRAYEGGKRIPPNKVVIKMIEIYNMQFLAYQHMRMSEEIGRKYLPDIKITDLSTAILNLQTQVKDYIGCEDLLVKIASDGKISEDEQCDFEKISKELNDIVEAVYTFKFSKQKEE